MLPKNGGKMFVLSGQKNPSSVGRGAFHMLPKNGGKMAVLSA